MLEKPNKTFLTIASRMFEMFTLNKTASVDGILVGVICIFLSREWPSVLFHVHREKTIVILS